MNNIIVDPKQVVELRNRTALPLLKCKEALIACENDIEKALKYLREQHKPIGLMDSVA